MQDSEFADTVALICKEDNRFDRQAYNFVRLGLDHTVKELRKKDSSGSVRMRHVSGQELLEGIRKFALNQFGPMTTTVFEEWNIRHCRDFGEIVFNMVEIGLLAKTEKDTRDDFQNGYDFTDAFRKPFWPQSKLKAETKPLVG